MNGHEIVIYSGATAIAATKMPNVKSHEVETDSEAIEVANPDSGQWRQYVAGRKGWSVNVNYLVTNVANLSDLLEPGNTYTLIIRNQGGTGTTLSGQALCVMAKQTYTQGNIVVGSYQFRGIGALS